MKIKHIFMSLAAVATLSACSSNDDVADLQKPGVEEFEDDTNLPKVEIRLSSSNGVGSVTTRGSVETDANGVFTLNGIGLFCLAEDVMGVNESEQPIDWSNEWGGWIRNEQVNAVKDLNVENRVLLDWVDKSNKQNHFYPIGNWYRYGFYAYYPYSDDVVQNGNLFQVAYTINGTQDIIWGKTNVDGTDPYQKYAYSAKYFRQNGNTDKVPNVALQHRLMRITFSYVAGPDVTGVTPATYEGAKQMGIKSVKITNAPQYCTLTIADKDNPDAAGNLTFNYSDTTDFQLLEAGDLPLGTDAEGKIINEYWVEVGEDNVPVEKTVGQGILLAVPDYEVLGDGFRYKIAIELKDKSGNIFPSIYELELNSDGQKFEAGKSYNVKMVVHGPKAISASATLDAWIEDDTTIKDVELN